MDSTGHATALGGDGVREGTGHDNRQELHGVGDEH